jgi:hypothetical protein
MELSMTIAIVSALLIANSSPRWSSPSSCWSPRSHERDHRRVDAAAQALVQLHDLGQHVERHHAEEHAGGEAEHEVKPRLGFESEDPTGRCGEKRQGSGHQGSRGLDADRGEPLGVPLGRRDYRRPTLVVVSSSSGGRYAL